MINKPHVHAECIKAWADGKQIQFCTRLTGEWIDTSTPVFDLERGYRVKPETIRYRVGLFSNAYNTYTSTADNEEEAVGWEVDSEFVRWLTDWIEVEV